MAKNPINTDKICCINSIRLPNYIIELIADERPDAIDPEIYSGAA